MSAALYFYSKNKIEQHTKKDVSLFLTWEGYYGEGRESDFANHDNYSCEIGADYTIIDFAISNNIVDFDENILYTSSSCFDNEIKVKFYDKITIEKLLQKLKTKMLKLNLDSEIKYRIYREHGIYHKLFSHLEDDFCYPYYNNLILCLDWLKSLKEDDKIILIAV